MPVIPVENSLPSLTSLVVLSTGAAGFFLAGPVGALAFAVVGSLGTVLVHASNSAGDEVGTAVGADLAVPVAERTKRRQRDRSLAAIAAGLQRGELNEEQAAELRAEAYKKYL